MTAVRESSRPGAAPWLAAALAVLAVSFQMQFVVSATGAGLRVSAADVAVPIFGAVLFVGNFGRDPPSSPGGFLDCASGAAFCAPACCDIIGWFHSANGWWAVVNKFAGWFVLLGNLAVGGLAAAADAGNPPKLRETFLKALFASVWVIAAAAIAVFILARIGAIALPPLSNVAWRLEGVFSNPNGYGYFVAVTAAFQAVYFARRRLFSLRWHRIGLVIVSLAIILSASRSAWLGAAAALPVLFVLRALDIRETLRAALVAAALAIVISLLPTAANFVLLNVFDHVSNDVQHFGTPVQQVFILSERAIDVSLRMRSYTEAFSAWLAHPIAGIGLGGFLGERLAAGDDPLVLIHNSALWLLTETGIVGFGLFLAFFVAIVRALLLPAATPQDDAFRIGMLAALAVFAGVSVGMEAMYQRHLWFLLGWALALPRRPAGVASESGN
jgi:O-antigen ligase